MNTQIMHILAIAWKELQITLKDRGLLAVLFVMPLLFGTLMSSFNQMAYTSEEEDSGLLLSVYVVNQDGGEYGRQVVEALGQTRLLDMAELDSAEEADQLVADGERMAAVVIPADFSSQVEAYEQGVVQVIVDPVQQQFAGIVTGLVNFAVSPVSIQGEVRHGIHAVMEDSGVLVGASPEQVRAAEAQTAGVIFSQLQTMQDDPPIAVTVENRSQEETGGQTNFFAILIPGFTVMFAFFMVGHIGKTFHEERDRGTFRRLLAAPIGRSAMVAGPMLAYVVVVNLQVLVLFGLAAGVFGMPLGDRPALLLVITVALGLCVAAFGLLLSSLTRNGKQADTLGMVLGFVLAGLGGAVPIGSLEPVYGRDDALGFLAKLTPHAHASEGYRLAMVANGTSGEILLQAGILLLFALAFFVIARWRFRFD